ncbi:MAG: PqqD family protein [Solirubrobacterales bacterium]|nr:PqqD family protein [Solirubrobacterales bacterium]
MRYQPRSPAIVHETVEGETIIVNLDSGSYFHMDGLGAYVWQCLVTGADADEVTQAIAAHHRLEDRVPDDVDALLYQLSDEGLLEELPSDAAANASAPLPALPTASYSPPLLNKHTDMQELLLLDPVHEVDETGWPTRA